MIANDQRRHGRKISELRVGQLDLPARLAVARVQADELRIGRREVEFVFVHGHAAMADMVTLGLPVELPDLPPGARVHGPHAIRHGQIHDAVDHERRALEGLRVRLKCPRQRERADVRLVDARQWAVAAAGIIAVVSRPGVGRLFEQCGSSKSLPKDGNRKKSHGQRYSEYDLPDIHFSVTR